ncbi:MAG: hypothetical protein IJ458_03430, partial [Clostridia bacterium]|nr:hypothetical protein [Clostridia bacterium]
EVRTWLNEVFYIESGISLIKKDKTTIPNNTTAGEIDSYPGTPTEDYIWLPSYQECNTWLSSDEERIEYGTDLTDATYGFRNNTFLGRTNYWTRSAFSSGSVYFVNPRGYIGSYSPTDATVGVRPAFAL